MATSLAALLLPAVKAAVTAKERQHQNDASLLTTLDLLAYRQPSGQFPESLNSLVPEFTESVPMDLFSGRPLQYRRTVTGFELYSVGPNETDDEGRTFDDEPRGDDLTVRLSLTDSGRGTN